MRPVRREIAINLGLPPLGQFLEHFMHFGHLAGGNNVFKRGVRVGQLQVFNLNSKTSRNAGAAHPE